MSKVDLIYNCIVCDKEIDKPFLTGKTLIKTRLIPYYFCFECTVNVPSDNEDSMKGKVDETRKAFWEKIKEKLSYTLHENIDQL